MYWSTYQHKQSSFIKLLKSFIRIFKKWQLFLDSWSLLTSLFLTSMVLCHSHILFLQFQNIPLFYFWLTKILHTFYYFLHFFMPSYNLDQFSFPFNACFAHLIVCCCMVSYKQIHCFYHLANSEEMIINYRTNWLEFFLIFSFFCTNIGASISISNRRGDCLIWSSIDFLKLDTGEKQCCLPSPWIWEFIFDWW